MSASYWHEVERKLQAAAPRPRQLDHEADGGALRLAGNGCIGVERAARDETRPERGCVGRLPRLVGKDDDADDHREQPVEQHQK